MRCMMCERFSLSHVCSACQESFLTPTLHKRKILGHAIVDTRITTRQPY